MTPQSFRIACPTWRHVQVFLEPSLQQGRALALRLPFAVAGGDALTLSLRLPNNALVAIESVVERAAQDIAGRWSAKVKLTGLDSKVAARLEEMMSADEAADSGAAELVEVWRPPQMADVPDDERERFQEIAAQLVQLRGRGAREALGLGPQPSKPMVEQAVLRELRSVHPDALCGHSVDLVAMGREVCIELERVRTALLNRLPTPEVAAQRRAGVFLCRANIDDWHSRRTTRTDHPAQAEPAKSPSDGDDDSAEPAIIEDSLDGSEESGDGQEPVKVIVGDLVDEGMAHLDAGRATDARATFAAAIKSEPRNRPLRALYHVAHGRELIDGGDAVRATTQFEAALVHDPECARARRSLDALRGEAQSTSLWKRLFGG